MTAKRNEREELAGGFSGKSELEKTLLSGIHGAPEWKRDEKLNYLGEFRERVIRYLTKRQVAEPDIYREIRQALQNNPTSKMIINGDMNSRAYDKYLKLARELNRSFTVRHDADYTGDAGIVIAAADAVDIPDIHVADRRERLTTLGLSEELVDAVGKKLCKKCYDQLCEVAPEEAAKYRQLGPLDRLFREQCPVHD